VIDEVAHRLERGGARSDDDAGPDLGDRYLAPAQHLAGLASGEDRLGVRVFRDRSAEVTDALSPRGGRLGEVGRGLEVQAPEVAACPDRMSQMAGDPDPRQGVEPGEPFLGADLPGHVLPHPQVVDEPPRTIVKGSDVEAVVAARSVLPVVSQGHGHRLLGTQGLPDALDLRGGKAPHGDYACVRAPVKGGVFPGSLKYA
jgi:hypothetical protein